MTTSPDPASRRLHALDNLRALMMWLGIVLHVCVLYIAGNAVLPWRDTTRTLAADLLSAVIHTFRMPVFFILAGFFVALLLQTRGPAGMAMHRAKRLGLPFALFWPPLFLATSVLALLFMNRMVRGTWTLDPQVMASELSIPQGPNTMHLWFLWLLLWMSLGTAAVARWAGGPWFAWGGSALQRMGSRWWGPVPLTAVLVVAGLRYPHGMMMPSSAFLPPPAEWVHHGLFFVFGLALFHHQSLLFPVYGRRWGAYALGGLVSFIAASALVVRHGPDLAFASAYNLASWLWSFALLGLALKVLDRRSARLSYLAESSYWVYLVHLPLTIGFGVLMFGLPMHALLKMLINIAATTLVCLVSYHLLVRFTWVGALLNGRRHVRPTVPAALADVST
jgi:glucans biosynthesis protein C